jgi:hypothetical protein
LVIENEIKISQNAGQNVICVNRILNDRKSVQRSGRKKGQRNPPQVSISAELKDSEQDSEADAEGTAKGHRKDKTVIKKKERCKKDVNKVITEIVFPWQSEGFTNAWNNWKAYKAEEWQFKYKSPITEQAALNELISLSGGIEETAMKIIEQSIAKTWKGFFELNNKKNGQHDKRAGKPVIENAVQQGDFYKGM